MPPHHKEFKTVFVTRDYKYNGIVLDQIIETGPDKFKSIKYRHTFYETGDFVLTMEEAVLFCREQGYELH